MTNGSLIGEDTIGMLKEIQPNLQITLDGKRSNMIESEYGKIKTSLPLNTSCGLYINLLRR